MLKYILFLIVTIQCYFSHAQTTTLSTHILDTKGTTVTERFLPPKDYSNITSSKNSFGDYVQHLKLKPNGAIVHYYNGSVKENKNVYVAVVDLNIGKKDLQQCADVIMHVRAEYLYYTHQEDKIHFTFTNGFRVDYKKWMEGYRIKFNGNKTTWVKTAAPGNSSTSFCEYMDLVYNYCGTLSLSKELKKVRYDEMQPGDILIKGGSPGHAELVLNVAQNKNGKKVFILSQSYMPAQEMQVLVNPNNETISPWYELNVGNPAIITPEWDFTSDQLMRFPEN